uniref:Uncharacterized protein n=1 Tax=Proboscia inermis TaxID=420281 RepID=A0A7S0BXZ8_9STRA|mmetsp:Transcript_15857/g.16052  ORF Transcript_15857/g.16052 Transcript_15857/m.16052 type:complete len:221 (+) Transcript_15857:99-761(+)
MIVYTKLPHLFLASTLATARLTSGFVSNHLTSYHYTTRQLSSTTLQMTDLYGIPNSGWKSPQWNWGSAMGTGHDCAMICRQKFSTRESRTELIDQLCSGSSPYDAPFEEVKLVLGLAWQNGRWDGSDGGRGGYGEVLNRMADADRYEEGGSGGSFLDANRNFVLDLQERYPLIANQKEDLEDMKSVASLLDAEDVNQMDVARRKCCGLVLKAMGFIEKGL